MIVPTAADLSGAQRSELSGQLRDEPLPSPDHTNPEAEHG